jgi:hypothetical protein
MWRWLGRAIVLYLWSSLAVSVPVTIAVLLGWDRSDLGTDWASWNYEPLWVWSFVASNVVFTMVPTIGILILPAWLMENSGHPVAFKVLAFLLTWWMPLIKIMFMASLASGVCGLATQLVFCCLLPLPSRSGREEELRAASRYVAKGTQENR